MKELAKAAEQVAMGIFPSTSRPSIPPTGMTIWI